jgi:hypothetical protein
MNNSFSKKIPGRIVEKIYPQHTIYNHLTWVQEKKEKIRECLQNEIFVDIKESILISRFNTQIADFIDHFFYAFQQYGVQIDTKSVWNLVSFLSKIFTGEKSFSDLWIVIWTGGSEFLPSVRMPIHLIPAIRCLSTLWKINAKYWTSGRPKVILFRAKNIAHFANKNDKNLGNKSTNATFLFLRAYLDTFHPEFSNSFILTEDTWFEDVSEKISERVSITRDVVKDIWCGESVQAMWKKHGSWEQEKSFFYAAAHRVYADYIYQKYGYTFQINLWWNTEKIFHRIARHTDDTRSSGYISLYKLSRPWYYLARDGDISIGEKISEPSLEDFDIKVRQDVVHILWDTGFSLHNYLSFSSQFN